MKDFLLDDRINLSALVAVDGIGRITIEKIVKTLEKHRIRWSKFWIEKRIWSLCGLNEKQKDSLKSFIKKNSPKDYYDYLQNNKIDVLLPNDFNFPSLLLEIEQVPTVLFIRANHQISQFELPIAVVGTRKMTAYGKYITQKIVSELCFCGITIVSGFMYGIDLTAHQTAISNGGQTIAFLGFGFNYMYPKSQRTLFTQFLEKGVIFATEYPPHISPQKGFFIARNRLVAGMSLATLVAEAARKSGSLITAQMAIDNGRDVFTIPSPITHPNYYGAVKLINQGATMIASGHELLSELGYGLKEELRIRVKKQLNLTKLQHKIIKKIQSMPMTFDELSSTISVQARELMIALTGLELKFILERSGETWTIK